MSTIYRYIYIYRSMSFQVKYYGDQIFWRYLMKSTYNNVIIFDTNRFEKVLMIFDSKYTVIEYFEDI